MVQLATRTTTITVDGWDGVKVVVRQSVSFSLFRYMQGFSGIADPDQLQEPLRRFGDEVLVSWNIEDEQGEAIPATGEGVLSLPLDFIVGLMQAWAGKVGAVPVPLPETSPAGNTSAEAPTNQEGQ